MRERARCATLAAMRKQQRLLIAGASGKLGRQAAEVALESCSPRQLVLVTRTPWAPVLRAAEQAIFANGVAPYALMETAGAAAAIPLRDREDVGRRAHEAYRRIVAFSAHAYSSRRAARVRGSNTPNSRNSRRLPWVSSSMITHRSPRT
mgnify:CR=1 FL=1